MECYREQEIREERAGAAGSSSRPFIARYLRRSTRKETGREDVQETEEVEVHVRTLGQRIRLLNYGYLRTVRGILNLSHLVLCLIIVPLVASYCQFRVSHSTSSLGFVCRHEDTYFFVCSCVCFFSSAVLFACFTLSTETAKLQAETVLEPSMYFLCTVLYLSSSIILLANLVERNRNQYTTEQGYEGTFAAAILGIIAGLLYGASTVWFFVQKREQHR